MLFLKKLTLDNFCNYKHHTFDFTKSDGTPYRFICFFGPNGCGKCCSGDTYVLVNKLNLNTEMCQISTLFPQNIEENRWYDVNFEIHTGVGLQKVRHVYYNGVKSAIRLTTQSGFQITGSKDRHKVFALKDGELKFVKIAELGVNDYICIDRRQNSYGSEEISDALARILGYLIAEAIPDRDLLIMIKRS